MRKIKFWPSFATSVGRGSSILAVSIGLAVGSSAAAKAAEYAGIVIDAKTGETLYDYKGDERRFPASLTKMMTLYLTFEALQSGKVEKGSPMRVSEYCSKRPPSKLYLKAGNTLTVESAIRSLVTKSANDAACVVGEFFGESELGFARIMTAKARQLGMTSTVFRNPHGLPNDEQVTTARDMARLGIALREHFPQYYDYFSTRSFTYSGQTYGNHNRLLGKVKGVDGIKTGYTRASGFNLVSSVQRDGRSIVAVVMGGRSGASRNAQMEKLIAEYLGKASRGNDRNLIARGAAAELEIASLLPTSTPLPLVRPVDAIAAVADRGNRVPAQAVAASAPMNTVASASAAPASAYAAVEEKSAAALIASAPARANPVPSVPVDTISTSSVTPAGQFAGEWVVQVGSLPSKSAADDYLQNIGRKAGPTLSGKNSFVTTFVQDGATYYRARYAGFSTKDAAWSVCSQLKKKSIGCYAIVQ